jgi:hypothetical protein
MTREEVRPLEEERAARFHKEIIEKLRGESRAQEARIREERQRAAREAVSSAQPHPPTIADPDVQAKADLLDRRTPDHPAAPERTGESGQDGGR